MKLESHFPVLTKAPLFLAICAGLVMLAASLRAQEPPRLEELRAQAKHLMEQAEAKKAEGATEDAKRLAEQAERMMRQAAELKRQMAEREGTEKRDAKVHAERRERLLAKIKELEAAGKTEDAEHLRRTLEEGVQHKQHDARSPEPAELKERLAQVQREIPALRKEGHHEEANRLEREARELRARLEQGERRRGRPEPRPETREQQETQQRLEHLRQAIGNLHAAGMHEPAEQLTRQAEAMEQELRAQQGRASHGPDRPQAVIEKLQREVHDLRQQVQELRKRLDEREREKR